MRRILLYIATNLAVVVVIGIILAILGVGRDGGLVPLFIFALVVGFSGSFISLLMSKWVAKRSVGAHVITQPSNEVELWLVNTVTQQAGLWNFQTPEVAIYDSPEPNAFATGASRNHSLVAVSTGLLHRMTKEEVEAVLAHEMAHIGNGDMVTMALLQGVVNTFVIFLSRLISGVVARNNDGEISQGTYVLVSMILQVVFGFLASFIVMWFSRRREYRADYGATKLVGAPKMIAALQRLKGESSTLPKEIQAMGIASDNTRDSLLSSHPSLENRIARLQLM